MLTYTYTARDPSTGKKVKADVQAESEQAAARLVQKEGLAPLEVHAKETGGNLINKFLKRVKKQMLKN